MNLLGPLMVVVSESPPVATGAWADSLPHDCLHSLLSKSYPLQRHPWGADGAPHVPLVDGC